MQAIVNLALRNCRFHEFLKLENEIGNITRQEAVSMVGPHHSKSSYFRYVLLWLCFLFPGLGFLLK